MMMMMTTPAVHAKVVNWTNRSRELSEARRSFHLASLSPVQRHDHEEEEANGDDGYYDDDGRGRI